MIVVESMYNKDIYDNTEYTYSYRLTKTKLESNTSGEKNDVHAYGIEVERKDIVNGTIINIEREFVKIISPQRYKVHKLLKLLCDNCVSPIHCIDVLGEYIDEYASDFDNILEDAAIN